MTELWDSLFKENGTMWGFEPAPSAIITCDAFTKNNIKNVLIPGIGYGRNAKIFLDKGMAVSGIEISQTAIDISKQIFDNKIKIYHGSVCDMPFDNEKYDGIFSYALIHLLDKEDRLKLVSDSYSQLEEGGLMFFAVVSKYAEAFLQGNYIGKNRIENFAGIKLYLYDNEAVEEEFGNYGLFEIEKVRDVYPFYLIKCKK